VFNAGMSIRPRVVVPVLTVVLALAAAAPAAARVIELGAPEGAPAPSCPADPCQAVSRTTGYQAGAGAADHPFRAPADGRIVAWSITLGDPSDGQREFFEERLGGEASAGITVLRSGPELTARVLAQSPVRRLTPYFGSTVQFPLVQSLRVREGHIVALTVPTWSPSLAVQLGRDNSWRATRRSRPSSGCLDTSRPSAQRRVGGLTRVICRYPTARLTYSVTMVTSPSRPRS
jgi:hypothetical protein